jgi:hypothetical protein
MSGTTINDAIGGIENGEITGNNTIGIDGGSDNVHEYNDNRNVGFNLGFLKAPTGEGEIENYLRHPLNINSSKSMARIIRGMSGMFGSLDLAIIDIALGAMDYMKPKPKAGINND